MVKKKDKTGRKLGFKERRKEIKKIIEEEGLWTINKLGLSRKYGCKWDSIDNDIKHIIAQAKPEDIKEIKLALSIAYKQALRETQLILNDRGVNTRDRLQAANTISSLGAKFTEYLEAYSLKDKVPEKMIAQIDTLTPEEREAELLRVIALRKKEK